jgi:3-oxoacyl-[acyl-carrier-protein] synthase-3
LSREEDLTKGILSTHLHSEGQHAEELALLAPGMGARWVTDIIADNNLMMIVISTHERTVCV